MADDQADIERLARVFLAGFQIPANATAEEAWRYIESEFRLLAATLPDDEAAALQTNVRRLIDEKSYGRSSTRKLRVRTKPPPT